jgi:flagellar basal-body rod modification protein FlgD
MAITPAINPAATATINSATSSATGVDRQTLAQNFTAFLQLLTTQLKNQNPLDPLDTNQFTQQLVQFAQVEQQLKSNDQLAALVSLQKTAQSTAALEFIGQTVAVDGNAARLENGSAVWALQVPKPSVATISITAANGQTVYSGTYSLNAGTLPFIWDGRDFNGNQLPDGSYTISVAARDANGQPVAVPTEIEGVVESVDLTQNPPKLSIAGQAYTLDKVKRVVHRAN